MDLLNKLDLFPIRKPFRSPRWKAPQRRNKNVKQIISEASRREAASMMGTNQNSGTSTPLPVASTTGGASGTGTDGSTGAATPMGPGVGGHSSNIAQAASRLDRLVLERNAAAASSSVSGAANAAINIPNGSGNDTPSNTGGNTGITVTYTNIESAPSLHPSSQRHYCDITGLHAPYTDPKSRLRYHDKEIFAVVRMLGQSSTEQYLAARGAHTVLK